MTKIKKRGSTNILLYRDWILFIELTTTCGTIGMEASCRQSFFEIQRETTASERYNVKAVGIFKWCHFVSQKDTSLQHVLISLRVN